MFRYALSLVGLTLFVALPAEADNNKSMVEGPPPAVFQAVLDCTTEADAAARLICYDRAVGAMDAARATKELVVTDRSSVREAKKGLFGLALPNLKLFGGGKDEELTEIEATIKSFYRGSDGYIFTLADGATWAQTDGIYIPDPEVGAAIQIRKASFGSYFGKVKGGVAFKIKRRNQ